MNGLIEADAQRVEHLLRLRRAEDLPSYPIAPTRSEVGKAYSFAAIFLFLLPILTLAWVGFTLPLGPRIGGLWPPSLSC